MTELTLPNDAQVETIERHLEILFSPFSGNYEGRIEIRCIKPDTGIAVPQLFSINNIKEAADYAANMNQDHNVYVGVNPRHISTKGAGKVKDIEISLYQFVDADDTPAVNKIKNAPLRPNFVVETGRYPNQRVHAYWRLQDPSRNLAEWQKQQEALADYFGGDRVIDPPRIMRLAGTMSLPDSKKQERGYKREFVRLIEKDRPPRNLDELQSAYPIKQVQSKSADAFDIDTGRGKADTEIQKMLELTQTPGGWHNNMLRVVATLVGRNYSDFLIAAVCAPYCDAGADDPDLHQLIYTARQKWQVPDPGEGAEVAEETVVKSPLEIVWSGDIKINTETFDFVEDLLTDGGMSVLYGDSNTGKTFFASDLAFHIAQGKEWRGKAVEGGGVIYLALEGARGIDHRIVAYNKYYNIEDGSLPFGRIATTIDLCNAETDAERLIMAVQEAMKQIDAPIRLVVVDTLSRALNGGNENAPDSMGALVNNCDRIRHATGAHVMLVHHTGKNQAAGARGHSLLRAATDTEIEVKADREAQISAAKVTKQRDMEISGEYAFRLETVELGKNDRGKIITSCVVMPSDEKVSAKDAWRPTGQSKELVDALSDLLADRRIRLPEKYPAMFGVYITEVREAFWRRIGMENDSSGRSAWSRALKTLKQNKLAGSDSDYVWVIPEKSDTLSQNTPENDDFNDATDVF